MRAAQQIIMVDALGRAKNPVAAIAFCAEAENNAAQSTYTFSGVSIGAANAKRRSVVVVGIRSANLITTPTVTLDPGDGGGARTMTLIVEQNTVSGTASSYLGIFEAPSAVATGTLGTVVLSNFSSISPARAAITTYAVVTSQSAMPSGTAIAAATTSGNTASAAVTVPSNGASIAAFLASSQTGVTTVTSPSSGFSTDYSAYIGGSSTSSFASGHDTSVRSGATTYTFSGGAPTATMTASVAVAWGP